VCAFAETGPAHRLLRTVEHGRATSRNERPATATTVRAPPSAEVAAERTAPPLSAERTREIRARLARPTRHRLRCPARDGRRHDNYARLHCQTATSRFPARSPPPEQWHSNPLPLDTFVATCGHAGKC